MTTKPSPTGKKEPTSVDLNVAFVFVHSYSSEEANWHEVMVGTEARPGRLLTARNLALSWGVEIVANDSIDPTNHALLAEWGIRNLGTARNTRDEVESALELAGDEGVVFVSSPDHLPRVVRDAMAANGFRSIFAASSAPFSSVGAAGVVITEPAHRRPEIKEPSGHPNQ